MTSRSKLRAVATAIAGGIVAAGLMAPGPAAAAALPDLKVTVDVTPAQASYHIGDAVVTTFTITNAGDATAVNVWPKGGGDEGLYRSKFILQDPFDLAPGETREIGWDGDVDPSARETGAAQGTWEFTNDAGEANPADNAASYRLPLATGTGTVTVHVFVDKRGTGNPRQPGLAGAEVVIQSRTGDPNPTGTTDACGSVTFADLPVDQDYSATVTGWTLRGGESTGYFRVVADRPTVLNLPLVPRKKPSASRFVLPH